jgi:hypothetical protein
LSEKDYLADIEKDGRPLRDIWTPTKESGEKRENEEDD